VVASYVSIPLSLHDIDLTTFSTNLVSSGVAGTAGVSAGCVMRGGVPLSFARTQAETMNLPPNLAPS
jgi:hypothetical protein